MTDEYRYTRKSLDEVQRVLNELIMAGEQKSSSAAASAAASNEPDYVKIHETDKMGISLQATKRRTKILEDQMKKLPAGGKSIQIIINKDTNRVMMLDTTGITCPSASGSNNTIHSPQIYELCSAVVSLQAKIADMVSLIYSRFVRGIH